MVVKARTLESRYLNVNLALPPPGGVAWDSSLAELVLCKSSADSTYLMVRLRHQLGEKNRIHVKSFSCRSSRLVSAQPMLAAVVMRLQIDHGVQVSTK